MNWLPTTSQNMDGPLITVVIPVCYVFQLIAWNLGPPDCVRDNPSSSIMLFHVINSCAPALHVSGALVHVSCPPFRQAGVPSHPIMGTIMHMCVSSICACRKGKNKMVLYVV